MRQAVIFSFLIRVEKYIHLWCIISKWAIFMGWSANDKVEKMKTSDKVNAKILNTLFIISLLFFEENDLLFYGLFHVVP